MADISLPHGAGHQQRAMTVLGAASLSHFINDMLQSLLPAAYPILKGGFDLSFAQIGVLTLVYQVTASLLQPFIGHFTDRRPMPYSLPFGMAFSLAGLVTLAFAPAFGWLLVGGMLLGLGSSVFHPEASRIARLASGGSHGLAQSLFQVGGNLGTAVGPLMVAFFVLPRGQHGLAWFSLAAIGGVAILFWLGRWYDLHAHAGRRQGGTSKRNPELSEREVKISMGILVVLIFSKYVYLASITSFYLFFLNSRFGVSQEVAQICQFAFFGAVAAGTIIGGPVGDRIGRKAVIWVSILGVLPFTLALPHAGFDMTVVLSVVIGFVLSSAFPAIVVYAQELMPGRVGMVSGVFFGLIFGVGGIAAAGLGAIADHAGIASVYEACSFLPAIGIIAAFLPNIGGKRRRVGTAKPVPHNP